MPKAQWLNPFDVSPKSQRLLAQLFCQNRFVTYFKTGTTYSLNAKTRVKLSYSVVLSHYDRDNDFAQYYILAKKPFAKGAFSKVYMLHASLNLTGEKLQLTVAKDNPIVRDYIAKIVSLKSAFSADMMAREYDIAQWCPHLRLLPPISAGNETVLLMKRQPGIELFDILCNDSEKHVDLSYEQRLQISLGIIEAVAYQYHRYGIVHRDIKPENIMVDLSTTPITVNIIDAGLAEFEKVNDSNESVGTNNYASPEAWCHTTDFTRRSDAFSVGRVLAVVWDDHLHSYQSDEKAALRQKNRKRILAQKYKLFAYSKKMKKVPKEDKALINKIIFGLTQPDPQQRLSLDKAHALLLNHKALTRPPLRPHPSYQALPCGIEESLKQLLETKEPINQKRLYHQLNSRFQNSVTIGHHIARLGTKDELDLFIQVLGLLKSQDQQYYTLAQRTAKLDTVVHAIFKRDVPTLSHRLLDFLQQSKETLFLNLLQLQSMQALSLSHQILLSQDKTLVGKYLFGLAHLNNASQTMILKLKDINGQHGGMLVAKEGHADSVLAFLAFLSIIDDNLQAWLMTEVDRRGLNFGHHLYYYQEFENVIEYCYLLAHKTNLATCIKALSLNPSGESFSMLFSHVRRDGHHDLLLSHWLSLMNTVYLGRVESGSHIHRTFFINTFIEPQAFFKNIALNFNAESVIRLLLSGFVNESHFPLFYARQQDISTYILKHHNDLTQRCLKQAMDSHSILSRFFRPSRHHILASSSLPPQLIRIRTKAKESLLTDTTAYTQPILIT